MSIAAIADSRSGVAYSGRQVQSSCRPARQEGICDPMSRRNNTGDDDAEAMQKPNIVTSWRCKGYINVHVGDMLVPDMHDCVPE